MKKEQEKSEGGGGHLFGHRLLMRNISDMIRNKKPNYTCVNKKGIHQNKQYLYFKIFRLTSLKGKVLLVRNFLKKCIGCAMPV